MSSKSLEPLNDYQGEIVNLTARIITSLKFKELTDGRTLVKGFFKPCNDVTHECIQTPTPNNWVSAQMILSEGMDHFKEFYESLTPSSLVRIEYEIHDDFNRILTIEDKRHLDKRAW